MYQALYRKWRPRSFDDVVSQPHITAALKNQIAAGKTAHAYLFTGSRGTGKTTCARIFAKAINCPNAHDGEPCLECDTCKAAEDGALSDIIEIDAASNSRVDDIRELREGVAFTPESCAYKVYIIDEVHMLSPGAFNALLKTMEEPPPHVKFILATTEVHKVPETIVSRCQHFEFNRIRTDDIVARLDYIAGQEGFSVEPDAASMIARISDGGMRDALSLLDRCRAYSDSITASVVSNAAGLAGREYLFDLIDRIAARDITGAVAKIDELHTKSLDQKLLSADLLGIVRDLMLIKTARNIKELIICTPDEYQRLEKTARGFSLERIFNCILLLQQTSERLARAQDKRIEMEMCMVRLCSEEAVPQNVSQSSAQSDNAEIARLKARVDALERALASGAAVQSVSESVLQTPVKKPSKPKKRFDPNNFTPIKEWEEILNIINKRSPALWAFMKDAKACIEDDVFCVIADSEFFLKKFKASNDKALLKQIVSEYYGKDFDFRLYPAKAAEITDKPADAVSELIRRAEDMEIEVEIKK